jgi:hypothetical protein
MNLLIGSSGYLATNLLQFLELNQTVTISRDSEDPKSFVHICLDLRDKYAQSYFQKILNCRPSHIYILSRPTEDDFNTNKCFYDNLKMLILQLTRDPLLSVIHFFSTTLVYDGETHISSANLAGVKPYKIYEYFKLDFELFLHHLSLDIRPDLAIITHRLPLLFGGLFCWQKNSNQFIYGFIESYSKGNAWKFSTDDEKKYGTSWAFVPDLCEVITSHRLKPGFYLKNVSSGFFTYYDLHKILIQYYTPFGENELYLYRSYFKIDDELGLRQINIVDVLGSVLDL